MTRQKSSPFPSILRNDDEARLAHRSEIKRKATQESSSNLTYDLVPHDAETTSAKLEDRSSLCGRSGHADDTPADRSRDARDHRSNPRSPPPRAGGRTGGGENDESSSGAPQSRSPEHGPSQFAALATEKGGGEGLGGADRRRARVGAWRAGRLSDPVREADRPRDPAQGGDRGDLEPATDRRPISRRDRRGDPR